jgi:putative chitinase
MILPLRKGDTGPSVQAVQAALGEVTDGIYGEVTRAAVRTWQRGRGLLADGVVGPATWAAMSAVGLPTSEQNQSVELPGNSGVLPTPDLLSRLGWTTPGLWSAALAPACAAHGITTKLRLACFLANVGNETNGGRVLVENLNYSAERLMAVWPGRFPTLAAAQPYAGQPEKLANKVYAGRMGNVLPGDGWRFRGRGCMQTTGFSNYSRLAGSMGHPLDDAFLAWLGTMEGAAESAAFFFEDAKMAAPADKGDIEAARIIANGGTVGLAEVKARYAKALAALA